MSDLRYAIIESVNIFGSADDHKESLLRCDLLIICLQLRTHFHRSYASVVLPGSQYSVNTVGLCTYTTTKHYLLNNAFNNDNVIEHY